MENKRRHKRFAATAFINMPVDLLPLPPYFGEPVRGKLIDLSAGGMALIIDEIIPIGTKLFLSLKFPDSTLIETELQVKRIMPYEKKYLLGFEFLNLPNFMIDKIERMSSDYIDCEDRIRQQSPDVCRHDCAFFNLCIKAERREPAVDPHVALELIFRNL